MMILTSITMIMKIQEYTCMYIYIYVYMHAFIHTTHTTYVTKGTFKSDITLSCGITLTQHSSSSPRDVMKQKKTNCRILHQLLGELERTELIFSLPESIRKSRSSLKSFLKIETFNYYQKSYPPHGQFPLEEIVEIKANQYNWLKLTSSLNTRIYVKNQNRII